MKKQRGRYYLSRVIKLGTLTQEGLITAILGAPVLRIGKFNWAITDAVDGRKEKPKYVFGKLAKYSSEGRVTVVDPTKKSQHDVLAPNLLVSSAPFVYLPDFSGIAFLHVWNEIQKDIFSKRFCSLIQAAYQNFFVECSVEPVADYRAFVEKLDQLDSITEMSAKVHPPNPLFGHLWEGLKNYIDGRNAEELAVREKKIGEGGINTKIRELMKGVINDPTKVKIHPNEIGITDVAMLMAADGYGYGKIVGNHRGEEQIIRTSDTHKSFLFSKDPDSSELAESAAKHLRDISKERNMKH